MQTLSIATQLHTKRGVPNVINTFKISYFITQFDRSSKEQLYAKSKDCRHYLDRDCRTVELYAAVQITQSV